MIAIKGGVSYLIQWGRVWLDDTTQLPLSVWMASPDPLALVWQAGYRATGWGA